MGFLFIVVQIEIQNIKYNLKLQGILKIDIENLNFSDRYFDEHL